MMFDQDKPVEIRKLAQEMNTSEDELGNLLESQIELVNQKWVNECVDRGKMMNIRNFRMDLDMSKVFRGSKGD